MRHLLFVLIILMSITFLGCAETVVQTKVEYVHPNIPPALLESCPKVPASFTTNGELVNSYIELQTAYKECSAKVQSIASILAIYEAEYSSN